MAKKTKKDEYIDIDSIRLRKMTDWVIVKRLFAYVRPFYRKLALAVFLVLVLVGLDLIGPLLFAEVLDSLGESPIDFGRILLIAVLYFLTMVANAFLSYQQTMLLQKTGQKIIFKIREDVFNHVEILSTAQFNKVPIGKLVTRVTSDTNSLNNLYTDVIVNLLRNSLTIVGVFILMFALNDRLSLAISAVVPFVVIASVVFRVYARKVYRRIRYHVSGINAFLSEHLSGMRMIQIFNRESFKMNQFKDKNRELYKSNYLQTVLNAIYRPLMYLLYAAGLFITLWFGAREVMAGAITVGILFAFTQYIHKFFDPIQELAEQFDIMQSAFISGERIFEVLDTQPEIVDAPDAVELAEVKGEIEFRNVWFAYQAEDWILKDVSFIVHPKETLAFVGATGSGKTTIMSLIVRNYDIQKGEILIDGINIKKIQLASLRSRIGQMLQDVFLFSGTIASNIRMGDDSLTEEQMIEAARYVNADRFIEKLPGKYQEPVRERGNNFSAGERQLMSFARTVIRRPSIMILDEATANIDTETEELIQESLKKMMNIGTMIIVAHRLSTIQHVSRIVVMQKGRIIEMGNHQQLLRLKGQYYNLYRLQFDQRTGKKTEN